MKRKQLPGFDYDPKRKRAGLDGFVPGTKCKVRRQRTLDNVTRDQALAAWKVFREELKSGRAIEGPLKLRQFVDIYYDLIAASHAAGTRKTQGMIIKNHLLRYFGETELVAISTMRVIDFMADLRTRSCSASFINDCVRVLKMLLRQAVERDVIPDYPMKKKVPKEKETPLRLELKAAERRRFFAAFEDGAAFLRHIDAGRALGPVKASTHFGGTARRFGGGMRGDSKAAVAYFHRFCEIREFFIVAVETGLRAWTDLRNLQWSSIDFTGGFIRVLMQKTRHEAEIPISAACRDALRKCRANGVASVFVFVDENGHRFSSSRIAARSFSRRSLPASRGGSGRTISGTHSGAVWRITASACRRSQRRSATPRRAWRSGTHDRRKTPCARLPARWMRIHSCRQSSGALRNESTHPCATTLSS